jgi:hypothetical protein
MTVLAAKHFLSRDLRCVACALHFYLHGAELGNLQRLSEWFDDTGNQVFFPMFSSDAPIDCARNIARSTYPNSQPPQAQRRARAPPILSPICRSSPRSPDDDRGRMGLDRDCADVQAAGAPTYTDPNVLLPYVRCEYDDKRDPPRSNPSVVQCDGPATRRIRAPPRLIGVKA